MSKIKVMSTALSNRIAAGEVIERPASVVKELVENAIDAGSSFINVEVERAGSRLIAVTDDGCGMDAEDARLALEQHGTSKLLSEADLENIMTLGFRGEALPSIASVSRFALCTRTADSAEGTRVECNGGEEIKVFPWGGPAGTRVEVKELFYNLPARKKFLKSAATEEHHIEEMMVMLAIGHPEVGFRLQLDGRVAFHTPGSGDQKFRLRELFGKSFVEKMLFFEHVENGLHISGCVAAPGFTRPSRREQRVFINSRPVEAQAVYRGIKEGYSTLAEPGRYNPAVLFISMPPDELDVNVHPAKREVRFKSEYVVSRAVASAVSAALRQNRDHEADSSGESFKLNGRLPLSLVLDAAEVRYNVAENVQETLTGLNGTPMQLDKPEKTGFPENVCYVENEFIMTDELPEPGSPPLPEVAADTPEERAPVEPEAEVVPPELLVEPEKTVDSPELVSPVPSMRGAAAKMWDKAPDFTGNWPTRIIGVLDNSYILCSGSSGLVLVDQHAAHERVMFEKLMDESTAQGVVQQRLLLPEVIELSRQEAGWILAMKEEFERFGFDIESAGSGTVIINAIPGDFGSFRDVAGFFADMLHELQENGGIKSRIRPENLARAACKAAVKAHDQLPMDALQKLLEDLKACRQGTLCPHGRPTMFTLSFNEIEKRFQRR